MSRLQLGIFLNLGNAQAKQHTNTLPSQSSIPDSWNNCHWIGIPKSPVPSPKRILFSAKVCIWYGFKYPQSSHIYEKVVIEMLWKISSFPTNLLCLFSPCMTTVGFAPASSWQLRVQPWAQASCSLHLGFRTHLDLQAQLLCCSFHAALSSSLSWDHIWVAGRTQTFFLLTSSKHSSTHSSLFCLFLCLPPTVTACLHFHGVQGPGRHEPPTRGTQVTLPLESPREGKASSPSAGDHENRHNTSTASSKEAPPLVFSILTLLGHACRWRAGGPMTMTASEVCFPTLGCGHVCYWPLEPH